MRGRRVSGAEVEYGRGARQRFREDERGLTTIRVATDQIEMILLVNGVSIRKSPEASHSHKGDRACKPSPLISAAHSKRTSGDTHRPYAADDRTTCRCTCFAAGASETAFAPMCRPAR